MLFHLQENREYDIPDQLDSPIGKRALIQLKKNKYNADHPTSSISVVQFLICEDLNGSFDSIGSLVCIYIP